MSWTILLIAALGHALAWLNRCDSVETGQDPVPTSGASLPDDVWAAFDATGAVEGRRTTVGGMRSGDRGFVQAAAAVKDDDGTLWLDAAAVVHPTLSPGRVAIRRDADGHWLQRARGGVAAASDLKVNRTRVPVVNLFD